MRLKVSSFASDETRNWARAAALGIYGIAPISSSHLGYALPGDLDDPKTKIYALVGSWANPVELADPLRAEVRRWILGGLALERVIQRVEGERARLGLRAPAASDYKLFYDPRTKVRP